MKLGLLLLAITISCLSTAYSAAVQQDLSAFPIPSVKSTVTGTCPAADENGLLNYDCNFFDFKQLELPENFEKTFLGGYFLNGEFRLALYIAPTFPGQTSLDIASAQMRVRIGSGKTVRRAMDNSFGHAAGRVSLTELPFDGEAPTCCGQNFTVSYKFQLCKDGVCVRRKSSFKSQLSCNACFADRKLSARLSLVEYPCCPNSDKVPFAGTPWQLVL